MFGQRNPIAALESALSNVRSALVGDFADPDRTNADERVAGAQRALAGADEALAALGAQNAETPPWLDTEHDLAARQREAERYDQAVKDAVPAIEQLRAALDTFIVAFGTLGEAGAAAAAAATGFREIIRDSAAEALHLGAQRKQEILTSVSAPLQPTAGAEHAKEQAVSRS